MLKKLCSVDAKSVVCVICMGFPCEKPCFAGVSVHVCIPSLFFKKRKIKRHIFHWSERQGNKAWTRSCLVFYVIPIQMLTYKSSLTLFCYCFFFPSNSFRYSSTEKCCWSHCLVTNNIYFGTYLVYVRDFFDRKYIHDWSCCSCSVVFCTHLTYLYVSFSMWSLTFLRFGKWAYIALSCEAAIPATNFIWY